MILIAVFISHTYIRSYFLPQEVVEKTLNHCESNIHTGHTKHLRQDTSIHPGTWSLAAIYNFLPYNVNLTSTIIALLS